MLIRYGYEMTFTCGAPTSMVSQLDVHPSCVPAVRAETPFAARPHVASWLYADVFGNRCRRFNAPSGDLTISNAGVIEVSGLLDPVTVDAARHLRARDPGELAAPGPDDHSAGESEPLCVFVLAREKKTDAIGDHSGAGEERVGAERSDVIVVGHVCQLTPSRSW